MTLGKSLIMSVCTAQDNVVNGLLMH